VPTNSNVTLENVTIAFRNFAGKEDMYNRAGDRNFAVFLDEEMARQMTEAGWNVKHLRERDEGDGGQAYIQVAVSFKTKPPRVAMVTSNNVTYLDEDRIAMLDWVDIEQADVTINPYEWSVGEKSGVKAYVKSLFIKIEEDYLQLKWEAYVDDNRAKQITSGEPERDFIDGEFYEHPQAAGEIEAAR
jgi:hypothetical protein